MQRYHILKLSAIINSVIFIFHKNEQTGFYDPQITGHAEPHPSRMLIMDFLTLDGVKVISVKRTRDNVVFSTADIIVINARPAIIKNIIFQSGTCKLGYGPLTTTTYIDMESAVKQAPPQPTPVTTTPTTRGRFTAVNVPAGSHGTPTGNIAQLEATLVSTWDRQNPERVRLSKTAKRRRESLHEFLIEFFENWNQAHGDPVKQTVFVVSNTVQTANNKRRSLGDLYMICKYYYPAMTLTELLRELYIELPRHFPNGFRSCVCNQINKRVWYFRSGDNTSNLNTSTNDEYAHLPSWYIENIRQ